MAGTEISDYVGELRSFLDDAGASTALLTQLQNAAASLQQLSNNPASFTKAAWDTAKQNWDDALAALQGALADALLGVLSDIPGLSEVVSDLGKITTEGVHGSVDLGPVHLEVASSLLVIQPPPFTDVPSVAALGPVTIGPFQVGEIAATLASPFGGSSLPGGGSIVRLPGKGGYGGTIQLPLGVVEISAAAIVAMIDGDPSFLGILGAEFLPPIQLSFGFSLDRVGGIVGVNRRMNTDALRDAIRTGAAGDVLFSIRPPQSPLALVTQADALFPAQRGTSLVGPSLKISWLSFGSAGSLVSLDLAVIVEIPTGRVAILGVARASIPSLPEIINLRLDLLGLIDPVASLVSIDASLVDSHVLGVFEIYGDAAMRFSWGSQAYVVVSVGGFFPGFNPEPASIPPLRRVGMSMDNPLSVISIRVEGYFAVTSNSIQFGGSLDVGIFYGLEAHGHLSLDAIVQFRPFHFRAIISAGFDISVAGFSFASVGLSGDISGPGPMVISGSLSISVFLFSIDWHETFTIGDGPADSLPAPESLLSAIAEELAKPEAVTSEKIGDPQVVLDPRPSTGVRAAVPPTGTLRIDQRRAPLAVTIDRIDGRPLAGPQKVTMVTGGTDTTERFAPGAFITMTESEALSKPPFDVLPSGRIPDLVDRDLSDFPTQLDSRTIDQIVTTNGKQFDNGHPLSGLSVGRMSSMTLASLRAPALSPIAPQISAVRETWTALATGASYPSATAAHQAARYGGGVALASADAANPVDLTAVS